MSEYPNNLRAEIPYLNKLVHACPSCKGPMDEYEYIICFGICNFCLDKDLEEYEVFNNILTPNYSPNNLIMSIQLAETENSITLYKFYNAEGIFTHTIHLVGSNSIDHFKVLLQRALNTWDDAPHELKSFVDQFIYGTELQDYKNLGSPRSINDPLK